MQKEIESLLFQKKTKDQLIEETLTSLSGLLADAYTGEDVNELRKMLPEKIQVEDIGVKLKNVSLYLDSIDFPVPSIEVSIVMMLEIKEFEIGVYSIIYDTQGEQIDEILIID
ncbi:MAG: hypothetical protein C0597_02345 [Marinilabiliales bacterium]|nr:MAG: hypothetical protein C0597_02345 [Marinilabiliales bacterium]